MLLEIKTKKHARELGLRPAEKWVSQYLYPKPTARPVTVKGEDFYAQDQCERVMSITAARNEGLKLIDGACDVGCRPSRFGHYSVYPESSFVPVMERKKVPPKDVDLLQAVFTVNKCAKRYRDIAQLHYRSGRHGFAQYARATKLELYKYKDEGIAKAYREERLRYCGTDRGFAVYRGEGYFFHSKQIPTTESESAIASDEHIVVNATRKGKGEARLKDAIYTLAQLDEDFDQFELVEAIQKQTKVFLRSVVEEFCYSNDPDIDDESEEYFSAGFYEDECEDDYECLSR